MRIKGKYFDVLTSDICKHFPNIVYYQVEYPRIKAIRRDAFEACLNLKQLDLQYLRLTMN